MSDVVHISLPASPGVFAGLEIGTPLLLDGPVFTARDATHVRLAEELEESGVLPYGLEGQVLFYAGPTRAPEGSPVGSVGPTTAKRMDAWTPRLLKAGIVATIGKGTRSAQVREACRESGAPYLATVGGAAALLGACVTSAEVVAYKELGPEALVRLVLKDFPVFVAIDIEGRDLYQEAPREWRSAQ